MTGDTMTGDTMTGDTMTGDTMTAFRCRTAGMSAARKRSTAGVALVLAGLTLPLGAHAQSVDPWAGLRPVAEAAESTPAA
ncbi:hypothetical protein, partial [Xanthobacter sp. NM-25]